MVFMPAVIANSLIGDGHIGAVRLVISLTGADRRM
jgi:hypothetical protein